MGIPSLYVASAADPQQEGSRVRGTMEVSAEQKPRPPWRGHPLGSLPPVHWVVSTPGDPQGEATLRLGREAGALTPPSVCCSLQHHTLPRARGLPGRLALHPGL